MEFYFFTAKKGAFKSKWGILNKLLPYETLPFKTSGGLDILSSATFKRS